MPRNKPLIPGAKSSLDQMKQETANEIGVQLGGNTSSRANGAVGGQVTKKLVAQAEQQLSNNQ